MEKWKQWNIKKKGKKIKREKKGERKKDQKGKCKKEQTNEQNYENR